MKIKALFGTVLLAFCLGCATIIQAQDGFFDPTFGLAGGQIVAFDRGGKVDWAKALAVHPDGHILIAGDVYESEEISGIGVARLSASGQVDEEFGRPWFLPDGLAATEVSDAVLQPDGKMIVVGAAYASDDSSTGALVCRLLANGLPDPDFAKIDNPISPGCRVMQPGSLGTFNAVVLQSGGRIALAGWTTTNVRHGLVARLDADGIPDGSFHGNGAHLLLPQSGNDTILTDIAQTAGGDLVVVGSAAISGDDDWQVFRLQGGDGALDLEFDGDGLRPIGIDLVQQGADLAVAVHVEPDGSILVGGQAGAGGGENCAALARLTPAGQFDETLDGDGLYTDDFCTVLQIRDMLVQSDGRVVLAGRSPGDFFATRLLPEGNRDPAFGVQGLWYGDFGDQHGFDDTTDGATRIVGHHGRPLLAGFTDPGDGGARDFAIARLENDLIFSDGLEQAALHCGGSLPTSTPQSPRDAADGRARGQSPSQ
jgi:uncharacterized delta-60 repeat protein